MFEKLLNMSLQRTLDFLVASLNPLLLCFMPLVSFYTPGNIRKPGFLRFLGERKRPLVLKWVSFPFLRKTPTAFVES